VGDSFLAFVQKTSTPATPPWRSGRSPGVGRLPTKSGRSIRQIP